MVAAGQQAVRAAQAARDAKDYILVVEGAIPTAADGQYCYLWSGLTALEGVRQFQQNARFVVAVGTCAAFGGVPGAHPNPTGAKPLAEVLGSRQVINIPGCPAHPDWIVGTLAYLFKNHAPPPSDSLNRPRAYFGRRLHDLCPYWSNRRRSDGGHCLEDQGCKGERCHADCAKRKWNGGAANAPGVSWCLAAGAPCLGCTEPGFPDGMSPFYGKAGKGQGRRYRRRKGWRG
jgi:hydrogenase small subunit